MGDLFIVRVTAGVGLALVAGLAVVALTGLAYTVRPFGRQPGSRLGQGEGPDADEHRTMSL